MAIKKSDLYSSLWASCDELRGGMDASQYKDYVLFMLFIKYVSDKYGDSDDFAPPVTIPKGASFKDMVALKGKSDIGDKINTQVIQPLIDANSRLARSDFNDSNKLGDGAQKVEKLGNLTAKALKARLKEILAMDGLMSRAAGMPEATGRAPDYAEERQVLENYAALLDQQADAKARLKTAQDDLEAKLDAKYLTLTEDDIKTLVVDDKWLASIKVAVQGELDRVSQTLTSRIRQLAERYATPLPQLVDEVARLAARVDGHLKKMGFQS